MAFFSYKAKGADGKVSSGLVEAQNKADASRVLHEKNLFVIRLVETKEKTEFSLQNTFKRVPFGEIVNFTRQIATMIVAGLSLPESLNIIQGQTKNQLFNAAVVDIEHHITSGGNFADALSKYPKFFPPIYIALVRAGESSGQLDEVMIRLADSMEQQREFRSKVRGAMVYPIIILVGMFIVIMIMMTVVIPKLTELYQDFGVELPFTTQLLINASSFFVYFWWAIILGAFGLVYGFNRWKKTKTGELLVDTAIFKVPLFGELQKKIILVEFTRTLSMLVTSGIRLLDALDILKDALGNVLFRNAIVDISKKIERGFPLGDTFAQYEVFPPIVSQMMKVGEETGKLDDTLLKLSKYFQSESENLVKGLTTAIEPIIMVFLGVGVGFIVISVITPIYNLTNQFQ